MVKKCLLLDDLVGLALVEVILGGHDDHVDHGHVDVQHMDLGVGIDLNITSILPIPPGFQKQTSFCTNVP